MPLYDLSGNTSAPILEADGRSKELAHNCLLAGFGVIDVKLFVCTIRWFVC